MKKEKGKVVVAETDSCANHLRSAADAISRAMDGLASGHKRYVREQIGKATVYLSEANFAADLKALVDEQPEKTA
jgi:hypothetical protein